MTGRVTVVIPAKNEEATVAEVVRGCRPYASETILVDGRSTDRTAEIAAAHGARVLIDNGLGKGAAIRAAIPHITGEVAVFIDADGSHDPADIPKLVKPILDRGAELVSASRLIGGSSELHGGFDEFFRLAGNAFITTCINRRFAVRLSDSQNGYRAIRTDVLRELGLRENSTTIEQEMVMRALKKGYRIAEVASHEHARKAGASHLKLSRVWPRYGYCLAKHLI